MFSPTAITQREAALIAAQIQSSLSNGTLGDWNRPPISIELKERATPYHGRPYPVAQVHKATLIKAIDRICSIGVLKKQASSQWASLTFIIPKKDMTVRTISDFRELNK